MPIALLLAYDGTDLRGFQRQHPSYEPTAQGLLEAALRRMCGTEVVTAAAGRTDAGVHARGQVVTFAAPQPGRFTPNDWLRALNALLPSSMAVRAVCEAAEGVHARFSAIGREYRYRVLLDPVRDPFRERYAQRVRYPLDAAVMQAVCDLLVGEHDFAAFGHSPADHSRRPRHTTIRHLTRAEITSHGDEIWCDFAANAFLTGMVRRMMGTIILAGSGRMRPADVSAILAARQSDHTGPAAPARGLCLMRANYPPGTFTWPAEAF